MSTAARPSSVRKHAAILTAAEELFLRDGYASASMDELTARSGVSKQTVYAHFGSKEALFVELVSTMTTETGDEVLPAVTPDPTTAAELADFLQGYGERQLSAVLEPRVLRLRRLVIGEVGRFPDLARVLWERGPARAIGSLTERFTRLDAAGLLRAPDPAVAAEHFNWLIMAAPINAAMLLGDDATPGPAALRVHVTEGVRVFLAAYGAGEKATARRSAARVRPR